MGTTKTAFSSHKLARELAHNIRNPLHAIRLNLYTLRLAEEGACELTAGELQSLIEGSEQAIDRVDQLITELVQVAAGTTEDSHNPISQE
jgi:signal transduction histidine kinase